jgi:hypothetical protein
MLFLLTARFGHVRGIVEANAEDLFRIGNDRQQPHRVQRKRLAIDQRGKGISGNRFLQAGIGAAQIEHGFPIKAAKAGLSIGAGE